jgi:hypothetical protein
MSNAGALVVDKKWLPLMSVGTGSLFIAISYWLSKSECDVTLRNIGVSKGLIYIISGVLAYSVVTWQPVYAEYASIGLLVAGIATTVWLLYSLLNKEGLQCAAEGSHLWMVLMIAVVFRLI